MFKRVLRLLKIARKLSTSGALNTINQIHEIPLSVNLFFNFISIGSETNHTDTQQKSGQKLGQKPGVNRGLSPFKKVLNRFKGVNGGYSFKVFVVCFFFMFLLLIR